MGPIRLRLLYFATVRERIGRGEEEIEAPAGIDRADRLADHLSRLDPSYEAALRDRDRLRCAVNQRFARWDDPVADGDEVAFFPPVTGG